jgi:hypothetical protein
MVPPRSFQPFEEAVPEASERSITKRPRYRYECNPTSRYGHEIDAVEHMHEATLDSHDMHQPAKLHVQSVSSTEWHVQHNQKNSSPIRPDRIVRHAPANSDLISPADSRVVPTDTLVSVERNSPVAYVPEESAAGQLLQSPKGDECVCFGMGSSSCLAA